MENEEQESGLTIAEIFHMILKRIWYVLGATVAVTLIAVLVVYFAVNPSQRSYAMTFNLNFPTGKDFSYPDGEPFFFRDMISADYLQEAVKAEGLESVDVARMVRKDGIEISAETETQGGVTTDTGRYTVKVKASYFSGEEQARAFISAVAQVPVDRMRSEAAKVNYAVIKSVFERAPFEERLDLLEQEKATLLGRYDEWIEIYDAAYSLSISTGSETVTQTLKDYRASVIALYGESVQAQLENELATSGYYYGDLDTYKAALKREYAQNKTEIEELKKVAGSAQPAAVSLTSDVQNNGDGAVYVEAPEPTVSQKLAALIDRNNKILHWVGSTYLGESGSSVTGTLDAAAIEKFSSRLEEERQKLETAAGILSKVTEAIYNRGMNVFFYTNSVETEGGIGIVLVALAAFVVSFLVAGCIVCAVETARKKKAHAPEAKEEEPETSAPKEE